MMSLGDSLKEFDLEAIRKRAEANRLQGGRPDGLIANTTKETSYECPTCRDEEGYFVKRQVEMTIQNELQTVMMDHWVDCECRAKRMIEKAFKSSRITFEFQKKTLDNFDIGGRPGPVQDAYHCTRSYIECFQAVKEERQNSIALLGNPGSGKTHLLMAVCNHLMRTEYKYGDKMRIPSVMYFPWVEGFNEIKDDLSLTEERINRMQKVDVLFIDDMWKGRKEPTPFQIEQAFAVINYRYMNKLPVLISSEKDIDQMCSIDEAIGSRINEMCKDFRVILKGGRELNYRLREDVG